MSLVSKKILKKNIWSPLKISISNKNNYILLLGAGMSEESEPCIVNDAEPTQHFQASGQWHIERGGGWIKGVMILI